MSDMPEAQSDACFIQLVIASRRPATSAAPVVEALKPHLNDDLRLILACGGEDEVEAPDFGPHVRVSCLPGASVFHQRARLPSLVPNCEWVVILDDSNVPPVDWTIKLSNTLRKAGGDVTAVIGATSNLRSTDAWSWAHFLNVLAFHWAPVVQQPLTPIGFNVAFRRNLLPDHDFAFGAFEHRFTAEIMRHPIASAEYPIDHESFRSLSQAAYLHWCNGRVTGALLRQFAKKGLRKVWRHALSTATVRVATINRICQEHPLADELPPHTGARVRCLAISHAAGALWGAVAGYGRALWKLG
jgi:hypothetical protein